MKITHSRTRQLEIAVSIYHLVRGLRPDHCVRKDSWSRVGGLGSSCLVFGKGAVMPDSHLGNKRDIF